MLDVLAVIPKAWFAGFDRAFFALFELFGSQSKFCFSFSPALFACCRTFAADAPVIFYRHKKQCRTAEQRQHQYETDYPSKARHILEKYDYCDASTDWIFAKRLGRSGLIFNLGEAPLAVCSVELRNLTTYAVRSWTTMSSYAFWICSIRVIG